MVYGIDNLFLVIDRDRVGFEKHAYPVATAAKDSGSIYGVTKPGIHAADTLSLHTAGHLLIVTDGLRTATRLAQNLVSICGD
jgi:hypothetical protein